MKNTFSLGVFIALSLTSQTLFAQEHGSAAQAVALVQKAISYYQKNGKEKTIAAVNENKGIFIDRDLYITITDQAGKSLAHGGNHRIVGVNILELRDADGKYFIRERIALVKERQKGWQKYKFVDPVRQRIEVKSAYSELADGLIFTCGIYE